MTVRSCKPLRQALALLAAFAVVAPAAAEPPVSRLVDKLQDGSPTAPVMVIAHRGCWNGAPENSIAAIQACIALGVDMVEIDVRNTADGALVLMHDKTVDRTTSGAGAVADLPLSEVRKLRLRRGAGGPAAALTDERPATLEEALTAARGRILVNLDLKVMNEAEVFALVERLGMGRQVVMKLYDTPDSPRLAAAPFLGRTHYMPIVGACLPKDAAACTPQLRAPLLDYGRFAPVAYEVSFFNRRDFLKETLRAPRAADTRIWVNTLGADDKLAMTDPQAAWGELIDLGVSMIQTDQPEALRAYLRSRP